MKPYLAIALAAASDNGFVAEVRIQIRDRATAKWWSDTGWVDDEDHVVADKSGPVSLPNGWKQVTWTYEFDPETPSTQPYELTVMAVDTSDNEALETTIDFTIELPT